jgi:hypothetical protein
VPQALVDAIRPMLSTTAGRLITLSTPWGRRGWWWAAWEQGGDAWERTKVTAYDCPRISRAWLEEERRQVPQLVFQSEYLGEFVDIQTQLFSTELILKAISEEVAPLFPTRSVAA